VGDESVLLEGSKLSMKTDGTGNQKASPIKKSPTKKKTNTKLTNLSLPPVLTD
jgi:hypothetical protein